MSYLDILKKDLIADEGYKRDVYLCPAGKRTVGIGHNLDANPIPADWTFPLTDEQIDKIFKADVYVASATARRMFESFDDWTENRQAAVVNLIFNMGETTFKKFITTIAALRHGLWVAAGAGLRNSKWYRQVQRSRSKRIIKQIIEG